MPKKTTVLIIILAIITSILIFVAIRTEQTPNTTNTQQDVNSTATPVVISPFATLSFSTATLDASKGSAVQKVDIVLDTNGQSVSGTQVELLYDPEILTNVSLTPLVKGQLFGDNPVVLFNTIDQVQGRISYAIAIDTNDTEKIGKATIGQLTFTVNRFTKNPTTNITFLPKSIVTTMKTAASVLDKTTPLQIIISSTTPTVSNP